MDNPNTNMFLLEQNKELKQIIATHFKTNEPWLTMKEVVIYSKYSERTIHRAVTEGRLKSAKGGGRLRFKPAWVDAWLESKNTRS